MSTNAIVVFMDDCNHTRENPYAKAYIHYDGYPDGFGVELNNFLKDIEVTNGISGDTELFKSANGMGCLVAQFFRKFKNDVGNVYYLHPTDQEYNFHYIYYVTLNEEYNLSLSIENNRGEIAFIRQNF